MPAKTAITLLTLLPVPTLHLIRKSTPVNSRRLGENVEKTGCRVIAVRAALIARTAAATILQTTNILVRNKRAGESAEKAL